MLDHFAQLKGSISAAALSFIVQDPREIIEWFSAKSFLSNDLMYRINAVSE